MKNDEVRAKREPSKLFLVSVAIFLAAGFTHSLTRDSLNMPLVNDPSVPVFPRAESTLFSGHFQGPLGPLFKRNKRIVTRRGIEPGPPGSKVIAVPMRLRRQAYKKRSKI